MTEHASFTLAGAAYEVVSVDGEEAISQLYRVEVVCRIPGGGVQPVPAALAGAEGSLQEKMTAGLRRSAIRFHRFGRLVTYTVSAALHGARLRCFKRDGNVFP